MKRTIFFDLDGTLIDISTRHFDVYEKNILSMSGSPLEKTMYWDMKRRNASWPEILKASKIDTNLQESFLARFILEIETPLELDKDTLFAESRQVLEKLEESYTLVLVSLRRNRGELLAQLERLNIARYFTAILSGHSESVAGTLSKKAEVIRQWGDPANAIIIGDTEADISAAQQLGITGIAVTTGIRNEAFLKALSPARIYISLAAATENL